MANVTVGKPKIGGAVFTAPAGTALPTDATTSLNAAFKSLGYISEDGVTNTISRDADEIKAWGGDTVLKPQTGFSDEFGMTFIESLNIDVLKAVFGDSAVTGASLSAGVKVSVNSAELPPAEWVIETVLSGGNIRRLVIPNGQITEIGEITYTDGEAVGYEVTITAYPDASSNTHYEYTKTQTSASS